MVWHQEEISFLIQKIMNRPIKHKSKIREELQSSGDKIRRARLPKRMKIAAKISTALNELDWNKKALAEELDKYSSQITKWLKGDHNFTVDTLSDIEEILKIKLLAISDIEADRSLARVVRGKFQGEYKEDTTDDFYRLTSDTSEVAEPGYRLQVRIKN
jgi:ribosome-binding protein aMBF1 (putative translation factor)